MGLQTRLSGSYPNAKQYPMPDIPVTFVCRPRPYPDESLLSYLLRLQAANGYKLLGWVTCWLRDTTGTPLPNRLTTTNDVTFLQALAEAAVVPVSDVYQMTLNRHAAVLAVPGTVLETVCLASGDPVVMAPTPRLSNRWARPDEATAFCPYCLRETSYHHLSWLLYPVFACTRHQIWLRDTCVDCGKPISVQEVVSGRCQQCEGILAEMPAIPLAPIAGHVQDGLLVLLQGKPISNKDLPPLTPQAVFRLLDGLCSAIRPFVPSSPTFYWPEQIPLQPFPKFGHMAMSVYQFGSLYTSVWPALTHWPHGFETFLTHYRQQAPADAVSMTQLMGNFYAVWLERNWRHPDLEPVQVAFNEYVVTHFPASRQIRHLKRFTRYPELRERFRFVDVRNAAHSLGVSPPMIQRLVRDGYVRVYPQREPARPGYFVYRADLEDALQHKSERVSLKDMAEAWGVSQPLISDWIAAGLLRPTGARHLHGQPQPVLTQDDMNTFHRQLMQVIQIQRHRPKQTASLQQACFHNGKVGLTATMVLQRVLDGHLTAYHTHPELLPFYQLWFDWQDVMGLTEQVKDERNWMGFLEVWRLLDVSRDVVHLWVERDLLVPVATFARAVYFDRDAVMAFHHRLLRSTEVACWLETSRSALSIWVRAGYLPVLSGMERGQGKGYVFDRDVITDWHTRYVTSGEIRRVLGSAHYFDFLKRVRQGVYAATEDLPQRFYRRCDLQHLQQELEQQL